MGAGFGPGLLMTESSPTDALEQEGSMESQFWLIELAGLCITDQYQKECTFSTIAPQGTILDALIQATFGLEKTLKTSVIL